MNAILSQRCSESYESAVPEPVFLKTFEVLQVSMMGLSLEIFSGSLPPVGMMRNGLVYALLISVRLTNDTAYSLWPTPSASDIQDRAPSPTPHLTKNGTLRHINKAGTQSQMRTSQVVRFWGTPTRSTYKESGSFGTKGHRHDVQKGNLKGQIVTEGSPAPMNPAWEELLLGLPMGWTDLNSLVSQPDKAHSNIPLNRHARLLKKGRITKTVSRHLVTPSCGSKHTHSPSRLRRTWVVKSLSPYHDPFA